MLSGLGLWERVGCEQRHGTGGDKNTRSSEFVHSYPPSWMVFFGKLAYYRTGLAARTCLGTGAFRRQREREQTILESVIDPALPPVARVPAIGLTQSLIERRRLDAQHTRYFGDVFRDGRHVQVVAEVGRLAEDVAARFSDPVAGHAHHRRFL